MNGRVHEVKAGMLVAKKGETINCPNPDCRAGIARFKQSLLAGAPDIGLDIFEWGGGQSRIAGQPAICHVCGAPFMQDIYGADDKGPYIRRQFFTSLGWTSYLLPRVHLP